jgi:hypothetical protein
MAALAALLLCSPAAARIVEQRQYGSWDYEREETGSGGWCAASRYYSNAWFSLRFRGGRTELLFWRDDFSFPWNRTLGTATLRISGRTYRAAAVSAPREAAAHDRTATIHLDLPAGRLADFLRDLRQAGGLRIELWTGKAYPVDLNGSARSLDAALACRSRHSSGS